MRADRQQENAALGHNRLTVLAGVIADNLASMRRSTMEAAEHALSIGRGLTEAKAMLKHGEWEAWLTRHFQMSARSARRYMQIAASGMKTATVADLGVRGAAQALAKDRRPFAADGAERLARLMADTMGPREIERFAGWMARAEAEHPDQMLAATIANHVSLAWLLRRWREAEEPAQRRFIEWLRSTKQATHNATR